MTRHSEERSDENTFRGSSDDDTFQYSALRDTVPVTTQREILLDLITETSEFLITVDETGKIHSVSDGIEAFLGYDTERVVGESLDSLLADTPDTVQHDTAILNLESSATHDVQFEDSTGNVVYTTVSAASAAEGLTVCLVRDNTDDTAHQRELESYQELVDTISDPMLVLDIDGRIKQVNDALVEYTGYERDELLDRSVSELVPSAEHDRVRTRLTDAWTDESGDSQTFETTLVTCHGEFVRSEASITALRNDEGMRVGSVGVLRDIRKRKRREQDLTLLKQLLTRVFRHNIRNELMVVQSFIEAIDDHIDEDTENLHTTVEEAVDSLLRYSEKAREIEQVMESPESVELSLTRDLQQAVDAVQQAHPDAKLEVSRLSSASVKAHPKITVAIEELLDNAIRHTPGGRVPHVEIWMDEQDDIVTLFIQDNAGGFDSPEIAVLRNGTESDLEHSSGVGLWLVRWIVDYSNAELIVHQTRDGSLMGIQFRRTVTETPRKAALPGQQRTLTARNNPISSVDPVRTGQALDTLEDVTIVGRLNELQTLERAYDSITRTGSHAVFVTGERGMGKSTLVQAFLEEFEERDTQPYIATGHCKPDVTPPYHVVKEVLADLPETTPPPNLLQDVPVITSATTPESGTNRRRELFADIAAEIRDVARERPVILLFEDLHRADQETVDLLEFLLDEIGRWAPPVLFIGTCRTRDTDTDVPIHHILREHDEGHRKQILRLEPLTAVNVQTLLEHALNVETIPEKLVALIHEHTDGIPLFVREVARYLVDNLETDSSQPVQFDDGSALDLPETIEQSITLRLNALPSDVVAVLELGAILGETFSIDVLLTASTLSETDLLECVDRLLTHHLWKRTGSELSFVHSLVREVILDQLETSRRNALHSRSADAIETVYEDALSEQYGRLATQYHEADDHENAVKYYRRAGKQAEKTVAYERAIDHYETARSIVREHDCVCNETRAKLLQSLADTLMMTGQFTSAFQTVEEGLAIAPAESEIECALLGIQSDAHAQQGNYDEARTVAERRLTLSRMLGAQRHEASAVTQLGSIAFRTSDLEKAKRYLTESRGLLRELHDGYGEAKTLHYLALVAHNQSDYDEAREYHKLALKRFDELDERRGTAQSLTCLGLVEQKRGQIDRAETHHTESFELFREIGDRDGEAAALNNLGLIARDRCNHEKAREYYRESYEIANEIGDRQTVGIALDNLGVLARRQGAYDQAREHHTEALEIYEEIGDSLGTAIANANRGKLAIRQGRYEKARQYLEASLETVRDIGDDYREAVSRNYLGEVAVLSGELVTADDQFVRAHELAVTLDNDREAMHSLRGRAAVAREQSAYGTARMYLEEAFELDGENVSPAISQVKLERARLDIATGELAGLQERLSSLLKLFEERGEPYNVGQTRQLLGRLAAMEGEIDTALESFEQALETFERLGTPAERLETIQYLVELSRDIDEPKQATTWERKRETVLDEAPEPLAEQYCE